MTDDRRTSGTSTSDHYQYGATTDTGYVSVCTCGPSADGASISNLLQFTTHVSTRSPPAIRELLCCSEAFRWLNEGSTAWKIIRRCWLAAD